MATTSSRLALAATDTSIFIPLFFYGTLQDANFLKNLLSLPTTPILRRATLAGYKIKLWSLYPILVPQEGFTVEGMLWDGATQTQFDRLEYYESNAYKWTEVVVEVEMDVKPNGEGGARQDRGRKEGVRVFVARDVESEELTDGVWSLEEFQSSTGW